MIGPLLAAASLLAAVTASALTVRHLDQQETDQ